MILQEFLDKYYSATEADEELELEIVEYIPFEKKVDVCRAIIDDTTHDSEDNFLMNSAFRNVMYRMVLIDVYTNIDIDFGNITGEFDVLESKGLVDYLLSFIPSEEINRFDTIMQCELNDLYQNERSQAAIARR